MGDIDMRSPTPLVAPRVSTTRRAAAVEDSMILDALGAAVLVVRTDGVITNTNAQAAKILRTSAAKLLEQSIDDVLAPLDQLLASALATSPIVHPSSHRGQRPMITGISPRTNSRGEIAVRFTDGSSIALGFSVSNIRIDETVHHVLLFQEISALLELRKQRDRLLQIAVIGEVMPTLLHELRNPLAAVTTMLEVLSEDETPVLQSDLHAILQEVRRIVLSLEGLGGLVRTMHSTTHAAIDLAVREACRLLEVTAQSRNVTLRTTGPDLPLLPIHRGTISGVVFNLVKNAMDACPNGGNVSVDARVIDGVLVLSVKDDGVGMAPEILAHCRELFFTTKEMGSGVGLALCHEVVETSGGALSIESIPGNGTEVIVRVPLQPRTSSQTT